MPEKTSNQVNLDWCFHHGMSDEDYDYLLWAMECDGIPVELLTPIREYFKQPVPTREKLHQWCNNCVTQEEKSHG